MSIVSHWPARLAGLLSSLRTQDSGVCRNAVLSQSWTLLNEALQAYLRRHSARFGGLGREEVLDLAAQKAIELLLSAESGKWDVTGRSPGEVAGYVSTVARNGLLDFLRRSERRAEPLKGEPEGGGSAMEAMAMPDGQPAPDVFAAGRDFARALCDCVSRLDPRSRLVWFFRVFYELPGKDIAAHPEIAIKPGHVNVLLQRGRSSVRQCMRRKGYEPRDMPTGTFLELWKAFRLEPGKDRNTAFIVPALDEQEARR